MPTNESSSALTNKSPEASTTGATSPTKVSAKPLHVRVVFYGLILLLVVMTPLLLDLGITNFTSWLLLSIAGIDLNLSLIIIAIARVLGIVFLIMTWWVGYLGAPVYQRRLGQLLLKTILIGIGLVIGFGINLAFAIIFFFLIFLWSPKRFTHWSTRKLHLYHVVVLGLVGGWFLVELLLSTGVIGMTLLEPILTQPFANTLRPINLAWLSLVGIITVIPPYIFLPRVWKTFWNARPRIEGFWIEYSRDWMGLIGVGLIGAIIIMAVFAPWITPYHWSYGTLDITTYYLPPSPLHLLGTNQYGQDIYSRVIYGSQISLIVGFTASITAVGLGTAIGLAAGYFGGFLDTILMRITDVFLSLPTLPLMLIFLVLFGQGLHNIIIVIAILGWTGTARMVRSETLSLRERPLTEAAHALGASDGYIIIKHILPNTLPLILANVIIGVVDAILSEAGITFLGFGDIHGQPSWGIILYWAQRGGALVNGAWWWLVPPGVLILLTTLGFAFVSHSADKVVNPRLRKRVK